MLATYLDSFFLLLAIVFATLGWSELRRSENRLTPAAKARLKMAIIFTVVAAALFLTNRY